MVVGGVTIPPGGETSTTIPGKSHREIADYRGGITVYSTAQGLVAPMRAIPFKKAVYVGCWISSAPAQMPSVNAWYLITGPKPWVDVYASANEFANGDPVGVNTNAHTIDHHVLPCWVVEFKPGN